jgi:aerobic carbon-monoxide dehydrogenase small subunit
VIGIREQLFACWAIHYPILGEGVIMRTSFKVNGQAVSSEVEPRVLLVDLLRDEFGLTGTKIGCDTGQCGSCVVHLNGASVKSCEVLAVQVSGADVITIEGVSVNGDLNALQEALWAKHGLQCGFCTPGMIMSLLDLLKKKSSPTEDEIRSWLVGNLCRCTGYHSVVRAVQEVVAQSRSTGATGREEQ